MERRKVLLLVALFSAVIASVHYLVPQERTPQIVFEELYYIPLLAGCMLLDVKGRILTYLIVSAAYIPHFSAPWTLTSLDLINRILHLVSTGVFAFLAGVLTDRERTRREREEKDRQLLSVGQAATVIVHDLRSPLVAILGFAKRAREGKTDPAAALQRIQQCGETMHRTVQDVLDYAKPKQLRAARTDLRQVIKSAVDQCSVSAEEKRVSIETILPAEPLNLEADALLLARALVNLVNNALDASQPGQTVTLTARRTDTGLLSEIIDHGAGMDESTRDRMFEPFFTSRQEGTGLGAAAALQIVKAHGGSIRVKSAIGAGTEIAVHLPAADRDS